ncbi:hypothetical protein [Actinomycetospora cinnamomea]|nr:hypothetical protein [Actinomycetospora cinnamomea]
MPGLTWPPHDTDRNRLLCRGQVVVYALVAVYFGLMALQSGALVPWAITTVALAATFVAVAALLLMRAGRRATTTHEPAREPGSEPTRDQRPAAPGR